MLNMEDRMPTHAQPGTIGYDIAEHDADGVGVHLITVYALSDRPDIEKQAARLLVQHVCLELREHGFDGQRRGLDRGDRRRNGFKSRRLGFGCRGPYGFDGSGFCGHIARSSSGRGSISPGNRSISRSNIAPRVAAPRNRSVFRSKRVLLCGRRWLHGPHSRL